MGEEFSVQNGTRTGAAQPVDAEGLTAMLLPPP